MKHYLPLLVCFFLISNLLIGQVQAQTDISINWVKGIGGSASDLGYYIAVGGSGSVYVTGFFEGTADFDPSNGTANLTSEGDWDTFLAKYDAAGNYVFAKRIGGTENDRGYSIALDGSENVYIAGQFTDTVDFDPSNGIANIMGTGQSLFIAKYDVAGNYLFAMSMGEAGGNVRSIDLDGSGNLYLAGTFIGTADFDPGPGVVNITGGGTQSLFIAKYDASGNYIYAKGFSGNSQSPVLGREISVDTSGSVYVTGTITNGPIDFDPGPGVANLTGATVDVFLAKYNAFGDYIYARLIGSGSENCWPHSIAVDDIGNVYVCGSFQGTADFDPSNSTANLTSAGDYDSFLAKYDTTGSYVFAERMGGSGFDRSSSIVLDSSGNKYLTGMFEGMVDFDPSSSITNLTSAGEKDIFLAKYDATGNYVYAKRMGGIGDDHGASIVSGSAESIYMSGIFEATADFNPGPGMANLTSAGEYDTFLARYTEQETVGTGNVNDQNRLLAYAANDYLYVLYSAPSANVVIELFDMSGRMVHSTKVSSLNEATPIISLDGFSNGVYIVCVTDDKQKHSTKLIY